MRDRATAAPGEPAEADDPAVLVDNDHGLSSHRFVTSPAD